MESSVNLKSVTFVIPHKGREEMLTQTLDSIVRLDSQGFLIDVIVVSQNTASTLTLSKYDDINLNIVHVASSLTISESRNHGVALSHAQYIAFLDADIELAQDWLQVLFPKLNAHCVCVSAMQKESSNANELEAIRTGLSNVAVDEFVTFLPGRNLLLAKSTVEAVGGFPAHLVTCEDYYFTQAVSKLGGLFYSGDTWYVHIGEDKYYNEMYRKEIWRGQSNIASLKGRDIPLREWPSFIVPIAILACWVGAVIVAFLGMISLSAITLSLSLLPVAIYSIRLKRFIPKHISMVSVIKFYTVYFPARAIGTMQGLVKHINV